MKEFDAEITTLQKLLKEVQKRIKRAPEGTIQVQSRKNGTYYVCRTVGGDGSARVTYIRKADFRQISGLAEKRYCLALERVLNDEVSAIADRRIYDNSLKYKVYDELPQALRCFVSPICKSPEYICREWQAEPFESNHYEHDETAMIMTIRGERVRSRAECIIADHLNSYGLAYKYEAAFYAENGSTLYPDFTIMHPQTNQLYYLEYWGLMDDIDYVSHFVEKMDRYCRTGVSSRLISIFENAGHSLDTRVLDRVIEEYFFR